MKLRPFRQEYPYTCLPACIRIVLDFWGVEIEEAELARACATTPLWGTSPAEAVSGLETLGYRALWFENASLERLLSLLEENWPVIVLLRAADLPHGRAGLHAIVVYGFEAGEIIAVDPALGNETRLELAGFLQAWSALGNQGFVTWVP